jgi:CRISPR/Cas system-associated exonuclease Cas4 (RecB family)
MAHKVDKMVKYLADEELPPMEKDKCTYCKHKTVCKELGE